MISSGSDSWKMRGGYRFRMQEGQPAGEVEEIQPPERVVIPCDYCEPEVSAGDTILTGQPIARPRDSGAASPHHSPVTGTVEDVQHEKVRCTITIRRSGGDDWHEMEEVEQGSAEALRRRMYESGVAALVPGGLPTGHGSSIAEDVEVEHLVVPVAACQPFEVDPIVLLQGHVDEFVRGVGFLSTALGSPQSHVVGTPNGLASAPAETVEGIDGAVHRLPERYPAMSPRMVAFLLLGKPRKAPQTAIQSGVAVVDVQTVLAASRAVLQGRPVVDRIISLGGKGFARPRHLRCRVGTSLEEILRPNLDQEADPRVVRGGLMQGRAVPEEEFGSPLTRADTALAALPVRSDIPWDGVMKAFFDGVMQDVSLHGPRQACISCSRCADHCPVGVFPYVFHRLALRELIDEAAELGLERCIDCGVCTLVCPAKIELLDEIRSLKVMLAEEKEML